MSTSKRRHKDPKISPPRIASCVPRERLFLRLDEYRRQPLVWVWGPPGAGKSVLVASYLESRCPPAIWYQVDADDRDPATFFHYLGQALAARSPRTRRRSPALTPEFLGDLPHFTRRFFGQLFEQMPQSAFLVLDNFQEGGDVLAELIREACAVVPADCSVCIVSREEPGPSFSRLSANRILNVVDWDQLKLTQEEAAAIAGDDSVLGAETVHRLGDAAAGWVAGFVLLLEHARRVESATGTRVPDEPPRLIFDYLAGELFARLPDETKQTLLRTALLPHCDADAAQIVSGNPEAGQTLETLHRRRLFTDRRIGRPPVYQFHPLFREFLLAAGRQLISLDDRRAICREAGALMERRGDFESSASLYAEAEDWGSLARLLIGNAAALLSQGRNRTLEALVDRIPVSLRDADPWLLFWRGMARIPFGPEEGRRYLAEAYRLFRQRHDARGRFLACAAVLDTFFFEWANFAGEDPWIREMEQLLEQHPDLLDPETEAQVLGAGLAVIYRDPTHPMLKDWLRRGRAALRTGRLGSQSASIANFVVQFNLWSGRWSDTGNILDELHRDVDPRQTPPLAMIGMECWTSIHAWMTADHPRAYEFVERALEIGRTNGIHALDALVIGQGAYAALGAGDLERTRRYLDLMEPTILPSRRIDSGFFLHLRSMYRLLRGDLTGARADVEAALKVGEEAGSPFLSSLNRIVLVAVLMEQHEPEQALAELARVMRVFEAIPAENLVFAGLLLRAGALLDQSQPVAALDALRSALHLGSANGYESTTPCWYPRLMSRLCALALDHGIEVDYVTRLVRRRGISPPSDVSGAWPWPVRIFTLGRFELIRDGDSAAAPGKGQKRQVELLGALIALGGRDVELGKLADLLWPEADAGAARAALDMALHRLRRLLGRSEAVVVSEGKASLNAASCWVDVWAAERVLGELKLALAGARAPDALEALAERLLSLFNGPFLSSQPDTPWSLPMRNRLQHEFLRVAAEIGQCWEESGRYDRAAEWYRRTLDREPVAEEFYRRLMRVHAARGERAEALNAYRRCERILSTVLGVPPSPDTEALRRSVQPDSDV